MRQIGFGHFAQLVSWCGSVEVVVVVHRVDCEAPAWATFTSWSAGVCPAVVADNNRWGLSRALSPNPACGKAHRAATDALTLVRENLSAAAFEHDRMRRGCATWGVTENNLMLVCYW
jgi:hypothetical protein